MYLTGPVANTNVSNCLNSYMWPRTLAVVIVTVTLSYPLSQTSPPPDIRTWSPECSAHPFTLKANPGPWPRCLPTPAAAEAPPLCCRRRTLCSTWRQPFRPLRASRWLLSAPAAAAGFSTASWRWRSWSAWPSPSWSGMWSPSPSLCKQGNPEHRRDTWKVSARVPSSHRESASQAKF